MGHVLHQPMAFFTWRVSQVLIHWSFVQSLFYSCGSLSACSVETILNQSCDLYYCWPFGLWMLGFVITPMHCFVGLHRDTWCLLPFTPNSPVWLSLDSFFMFFLDSSPSWDKNCWIEGQNHKDASISKQMGFWLHSSQRDNRQPWGPQCQDQSWRHAFFPLN